MKKFNFYLVTDTHYFEPSLGASGKAFDEYMSREQYFMAESSDIAKAVFADIAADNETEYVIIPGDLSKNGEIESHKSFIKELYKLREAGKKIFVITAGHDYNKKSRAFVNDECIEAEGTPFCILSDLYKDFGYSQALSVDEKTLSYVAELSDGIRLLAINCDAENNPKGTVDERLSEWIKCQLDEARNARCEVIAICHYPVIPPVPVFELVGDAKLKNWRNTATLLADNGVKLILTGHMHIQSINKFTTEKGNTVVDICTSCLTGSPAKYRKISYSSERIEVNSIDVPEFRSETHGVPLDEFFDNQFRKSIVNRINNIFKGDGILKKLGRKTVNSLKVGTIGRFLFIKVDNSLKKTKIIDLAGEIGVAIFKGDQPYIKGTPVGDAFDKLFDRVGFILGKVETKLSKNGEKICLKEMLMNTVGNNKGFSDNNGIFSFKE
ncbi:MAG: metallophosphoesterase [Lachnospiraceae bacterium]|nr:metallophosphoesterase [Lachnospiraceae bacterium]